MGTTETSLLDAAEIAMRSRGYHGVSFRELADDVGIKSASVHYYFPQKADLAVALVNRYSDGFFAGLAGRVTPAFSAQQKLQAFCDSYRDALKRSDLICLCGMLGAESGGLPDPVAEAVAAFFEANVAWLGCALPAALLPRARRVKSAQILATLQGGMLIATALKDINLFDGIVQHLLDDAAL